MRVVISTPLYDALFPAPLALEARGGRPEEEGTCPAAGGGGCALDGAGYATIGGVAMFRRGRGYAVRVDENERENRKSKVLV